LKRGSEKLSGRIEIPVEDDLPGIRAGMTAITQRIGHREPYPAIRPDLRVWPYLSVTISEPNIDLGKLSLEVLEIETSAAWF
jgi:hypothetical protein